MASSQQEEDPLIATLPPVTDYITYLTLLEYQLTPYNLPTLNRLLSDDDGTLATEIGWDLLKLVLPMLQVVPDEANTCLGIIARRGNPREVVVRVAEELERLETHTHDSDSEDEDELPTFAGEATRVHLGDMTLDGMPPHPVRNNDDKSIEQHEDEMEDHAESGSDNGLLLRALLSMLGMLHPRIKTQYPSRFLATSLPAALKAYRHIAINHETTSSFVDFLTKMSGRQRPTLPPRKSTAASITTVATPQLAGTGTSAPLPDPEAKSEALTSSTPVLSASDNEKNIIERLLQAVALEVIDEYTQSLATMETPHMNWTGRLRELQEPQRVIPRRLTELQKWHDQESLRSVDALMTKFVKLGKDLDLDIVKAVHILGDASSDERDDDMSQVESDYPTSPADIPFPTTGLILLCAAQQFYQPDANRSEQPSILPLGSSLKLLSSNHSSDPTHTAASDALLSLIYSSLSASTTSSSIIPQPEVLKYLDFLTDLFVTSHDSSVRDNAHHIARKLLHSNADQDTKLSYISNLMSPKVSTSSPIHSIQAGNLKAIAIDYLKDEILSGSLNSELLSTDTNLVTEIFPPLPAVPGPFISSQPTSTTTASMSTEEDLEDFLLHIPAYISALNLICVLANLEQHQPQHNHTENPKTISASSSNDTPKATSSLSGSLLSHSKAFLTNIEPWKDTLLVLLTAVQNGRNSSTSNDQSPINMSDVFALEDACSRAKSAIANIED